jgi:hypothetical protein
MAQLPDSDEEEIVGIPGEWKVREILQRLQASCGLRLP